MRARDLVSLRPDGQNPRRQALHCAKTARAESFQKAHDAAGGEACGDDLGGNLSRDGGGEAVGQHDDVDGGRDGGDGAAQTPRHADGGADFLLVVDFDAGVGEAQALVPADREARHGQQTAAPDERARRAVCHRGQKSTPGREDGNALPLLLAQHRRQTPAHDLARDNRNAGDTVQPPGAHARTAIIREQDRHHLRPDNRHRVIDTCAEAEQRACGDPGDVFEELHRQHGLAQRGVELVEDEGDEGGGADEEGGEDVGRGPGVHGAAPQEAELEEDEAGDEEGGAEVVEHLQLLRLGAEAMLHVEGGRVVEGDVEEA